VAERCILQGQQLDHEHPGGKQDLEAFAGLVHQTGDELRELIDQLRELIDQHVARVHAVLLQHASALQELAEALVQRGRLSGDEVLALLDELG
jgi:polyhydroxyalkanoate synthesis regulator phasin